MQITGNIHAFIWQSTAGNNCNTYLIDGPTRVLIDPGHSSMFDPVHKGLSELGLTIEDIGLIICTHGHPDHMEGVQLFGESPALLTLHQKEWQFVKSMRELMNRSAHTATQSTAPHFFLKEGDLKVDGLDFQVLHTPGHSPGSVSIYWPDEKVLVTGDVVFKGGLGRTDLPGGDGPLLKESIQRLAQLDVEWLLPGHGDIIGGDADIKTNFGQLEQVWFGYI